ncbi:MAG: PAS domain-containing sensor histidine kinase, partial [Planctomycetes bacterium]|nr:PAS domain-containing sensor histidine kinase [Planctomycetota bacterium]
MARKSLLWRYYLFYFLITLTSLVGVAWYANHTIRSFYLSQAADNLEARARLLTGQVLPLPSIDEAGDLNLLCTELGRQSRTRITVILPDGVVLCDSEEDPARMENHANRPEIAAAILGRKGVSVRHSYTLDKDMMYVAVPLR